MKIITTKHPGSHWQLPGWYWELWHEDVLVDECDNRPLPTRALARAAAIMRAEQIVAQWIKALAKVKARKEGGK